MNPVLLTVLAVAAVVAVLVGLLYLLKRLGERMHRAEPAPTDPAALEPPTPLVAERGYLNDDEEAAAAELERLDATCRVFQQELDALFEQALKDLHLDQTAVDWVHAAHDPSTTVLPLVEVR